MLSVPLSHKSTGKVTIHEKHRWTGLRDMSFARKEISESAFGIIFHHPLLQTLEIAKKHVMLSCFTRDSLYSLEVLTKCPFFFNALAVDQKMRSCFGALQL